MASGLKKHSVALKTVGILTAVAAVVIACGTGPESAFEVPLDTTPEAGASSSGSVGPFVGDDAGPVGPGCKPKTCADLKANCGPVGDGCGAIVNCGTCKSDETCGGGGVASQCGKPACSPKTCKDLGVECGPVGDGCGNLIASCGTCDGGTCGAGGPSKCGASSALDGGACVPTKTTCVAGDCGPIANGCGGLVNCPTTCPAGQTCGGGGIPSLCGAPPCVKKTCAGVGANCGFIADGCGGVVNCWGAGAVCPPGQTCGGAGAPNVCGTVPGCTGLCLQQQACPGGGTTSIEGYVTSPNGVLPIPNAIVYVPNAAVAAFPAGVSCETCATASGSPLISTTTDSNGHFLLPNMPVSDPAKVNDIPVVVQLGRWRKQFTIRTMACTSTLVPATSSALPKNHFEGDIPLTAISTGAVDALECVFRKIGVDDAEFTPGNGTGRIRLYQDNGACIPTGAGTCAAGGNTSPKASALYTPCTGAGCKNEIDKFDQVIFGCVGFQDNKAANVRNNVLGYANKGGRIFATHYAYVWLHATAPWSGTASWLGGLPNTEVQWDSSIQAFVDTTFPKGTQFANWLQAPLAPISATYPPPYAAVNGLFTVMPPSIQIAEARKDINVPAGTTGVTAPAQRWLYTTNASIVDNGITDPPAEPAVMHYTFNTDWSKPAAQQCGRVVYSDFHVTTGLTEDVKFPAECAPGFSSQEKVLAYMLFDLASCVSTSGPPVCAPKTCAAQGLGCGLGGDGCGNQIDCGPCPPGKTCGGGGVPSQCGSPSCVPNKCAAGQCGLMGDGCGGSLDCGNCLVGTCGGGGPNVCGAAPCVPKACPVPAPGSVCGPVANGCGGLNNCACPPGVPCVNGTCGAPACTPRTCAQAGANCGQIADGCGNIINCGDCLAPQTCGGGGIANVCGGIN